MSGRQPSGDLLIVLDENIASEDLRDALAPIAATSGARVELHTAHFPRETKDPVWMPIAAKQRWAVISCDVSVKRRPAEKEILMRAGVCVYILRGVLNRDQIRDALAKALPTICRRHRQLAPPVICHISRDGDVTVKIGGGAGGSGGSKPVLGAPPGELERTALSSLRCLQIWRSHVVLGPSRIRTPSRVRAP